MSNDARIPKVICDNCPILNTSDEFGASCGAGYSVRLVWTKKNKNAPRHESYNFKESYVSDDCELDGISFLNKSEKFHPEKPGDDFAENIYVAPEPIESNAKDLRERYTAEISRVLDVDAESVEITDYDVSATLYREHSFSAIVSGVSYFCGFNSGHLVIVIEQPIGKVVYRK